MKYFKNTVTGNIVKSHFSDPIKNCKRVSQREAAENNLVNTVSVILKKDVTEEEAKHFALTQYGTLLAYLRNNTINQ